VKRFLIRRGFKIWPPYFVLVAVTFFALHFAKSVISPARPLSWIGAFRVIVPNLLHVQNYLGSARAFTWSLSVEEHFYLALPVFLMVVLWSAKGPVTRMPAVPIAAIIAILGITIFRTAYNWNKPFHFLNHAAYTHLRIDGLFFGVLLAYLHHFHAGAMARLASYRWLLFIVGIALLSPMFVYEDDNRFCWTIGFTMLYVGYGAILLAMVYTIPGRGIVGSILTLWPMRAIAWVGFFSYSIYLWQEDLAQTPIRNHLLVGKLTRLPTAIYWPGVEAVHLLFAIGAGVIMAKLIEIPSIALRDRLFPARTTRIDQHLVKDVDRAATQAAAEEIVGSPGAPV
jgi:peptidoglycan/LPS O-acetylase OafA/YrhL